MKRLGFWPCAVAGILLCASGPSLAYYHPTVGRWASRDALEHAYAQSTFNLYEYTYSSPACYTDAPGTTARIPVDPEPCGKFIIRAASVPVDPRQFRGNQGASTRKGYEVQFDDKGCEKKCCDSIRLVQAIATRGFGSDPAQFDGSVESFNKNRSTPGGIPPPAYPGARGTHGQYSYVDSPLDTRNIRRNNKTGKGGTMWDITTCAVCTKKRVDSIINSLNFTFDDGSKQVDVPGATPHIDEKTKKPDGLETEGGKPGYPWEDTFLSKGAMSNWIEIAGKERGKGK